MMLVDRLSPAMARTLILVMAASAILVPFAARAALANHDAQKISLHRCDGLKHDRALGPASGTDSGLN